MRLDGIQALRALAAYLVLLYHARAMEIENTIEAGTREGALLGGPVINGYAGVDLFFVISGFIMTYVTANRPRGLATVKDFVLSRVFRIYPVWWLFMGLMALYLVVSYGVPYDTTRVTPNDNSALNHIIRSILLLPQPDFPILGVGWTLIHEMYFYVVFAGLLFAPRNILPAFLGCWALLVILGAFFGFSGPFADDILALVTSPMTLQFICGAFVGLAFLKWGAWRPVIVCLVGIVAFVTVLTLHPDPSKMAFSENVFFLEWGRVLVYTLPCALLVYGFAGVQGRFGGWVGQSLSNLGDWSYALYLSHILVLAALRRIYPVVADILTGAGVPDAVTDVLRLGAPGIWDNVFFIVSGVIAATIVAGLSYRLFESPVSRLAGHLRGKASAT